MDARERELAFKGALPKMAAWQGDRTTAERVNGGGETVSMTAFLCYRPDTGSLLWTASFWKTVFQCIHEIH